MDCSNICRVFQHKFTALLQFCLATGCAVVPWSTAWFFVTRRDLCVGHFVLYYETCFHFSRYIVGQNSRIWSAENPSALHENPLISLKSFWVPCVSQMNCGSKVLWGERGGDWIFSIGCNHTLIMALLASLKNKIVYSIGLHFIRYTLR